MRLTRLLAAILLLPQLALAQSLPSPAFKAVTVGGSTISGVGTAAGTVAGGPALAAETTRATAAEGANASAVSGETSRAQGVEATLAPLASPALTGTPTAPTAASGTSSSQIATTSFAQAIVALEASRASAAEAFRLRVDAAQGLTVVQQYQGRVNLGVDARTEVADANYSIQANDRFVALTAVTASRSLVLPTAASVAAGKRIRVTDETGGVSSSVNLVVVPQGSDHLDGLAAGAGLALAAPFASMEVVSDGSSKWSYAVLPVSQGGSGSGTAAGARASFGAAASGANSDITALLGAFSTPIAVSNGGTGDAGTAWTAYTPSVAANSGTFTSVSATGRYKKIGRTVLISISVSIATQGSAAGGVIASLPFTAATGLEYQLNGRENATTGSGLTAVIGSGATSVTIDRYDGAYIGSNGYRLVISGVYEAAS